MKISPSICIDLGAAFSKISIRAHPNDTSILLGDPGQTGDYQICIPSLALHRQSTDSWLFGWELLDLDPKNYRDSGDIKIYQNWKSNLFPTDRKTLRFFGSDEDRKQAIICCREFLTSLKTELIPLMLELHPQFRSLSVDDFTTCVCVPDFVLNSKSGKLIDKIMREAGFQNPGSYCVSEPKCSLLGVLTEGQNYVNDDGTPNVNYMFREFDLLERLTSEGDSVFFLDIGAFTTDLALTNLENKTEDEIENPPSASYPWGIFKLDEMSSKACGPEFVKLLQDSEASFRENFHRIAYGGKENDIIQLRDGTELNSEKITRSIDDFCDAILQCVDQFLSSNKAAKIDIAVLTGGGTICSRISSRIAAGLGKYDIKVVRAHKGANVGNLDPISSEIVRGSSAIGGTSILYSLK